MLLFFFSFFFFYFYILLLVIPFFLPLLIHNQFTLALAIFYNSRDRHGFSMEKSSSQEKFEQEEQKREPIRELVV